MEAIFVIIFVTLIVLLAYIIASRRDEESLGSYSSGVTSSCSVSACNATGTQTSTFTCTPNPETGYGCKNPVTGVVSFAPYTTTASCSGLCAVSEWGPTTTGSCIVYTDDTRDTLATNQACLVSGTEKQFVESQRQCVARDTEGDNACVKEDGSLAVVGEIEKFVEMCEEKTACYPGDWSECPADVEYDAFDPNMAVCATYQLQPRNATCVVDGANTTNEQCDPADNPVCANALSYNYPCSSPDAYGITTLDLIMGKVFNFRNQSSGETFSIDPTPAQEAVLTGPVADYTTFAQMNATWQSADSAKFADLVLLPDTSGGNRVIIMVVLPGTRQRMFVNRVVADGSVLDLNSIDESSVVAGNGAQDVISVRSLFRIGYSGVFDSYSIATETGALLAGICVGFCLKADNINNITF